MSDVINGKPPTSFWIIGAVALVWNLIGLFVYYSSVSATPEMLVAQGFSQEQIDMMLAMPAWATSANAIAVTFGILGSLLLLFRKAWAVPAFIVSLLGVVVQDIYGFVIADAIGAFGAASLVLPVIVLVIAVALLIYSRGAKAKGWLG